MGLLKIHFLLIVQLSDPHFRNCVFFKYYPQGGTVGLLMIPPSTTTLHPPPYLNCPALALKSPLNPKSPFVHHLLHFLFLSSFHLRSPEESAEPVPPSPGRWSQDLLGELDRYRKSSIPPKPQILSYANNYPFVSEKSIAPLSVAS